MVYEVVQLRGVAGREISNERDFGLILGREGA